MSVLASTLSKARLVVGRDFIGAWEINPDPGIPATAQDVIDDLVGASVTASIVDTDDEATVIVASADITGAVDSPSRSILLTIAAADMADITPGFYRWSVFVTLSGGEKYAVTGLGRAQVFAA